MAVRWQGASDYNTQGCLLNYTASSNLIGGGSPAFNLWNPQRQISHGTDNIGLYLFNSISLCAMEASNSAVAGAQGVWLNFLQRTGSADTFSPIGNQTNVFQNATTNSFYDCLLVPLDTNRGSFAAIGWDTTNFYYRKMLLTPSTQTVTYLSDIGSASVGIGWWNAVKLDTDDIAILFTGTNTQSLFSVKFNEPLAIFASSIYGVRQFIGISKIQFVG